MLGGAGCDAGSPATSAPTTSATTTAPTTAAAPPRTRALPAICRADRARHLGRITDPSLDEISGLTRGRRDARALFAVEDSGAPPVVTALRADGTVTGSTTLAGAVNTDWEDVATGPGPGGEPSLFVADTGDNAGVRAAVRILRITEPDATAITTADTATVTLRDPDGPHDAETLLVDPLRRDLVLVTKRLGAGRAYAARSDAPGGSAVMLRPGPAVPVAAVTGGDVSADGRLVVLRSYSALTVWRRRGSEPLTRTLQRTPTCVAPADLTAEGQGEAVALDPDGRAAVTVPEGPRPTLRRYGSTR